MCVFLLLIAMPTYAWSDIRYGETLVWAFRYISVLLCVYVRGWHCFVLLAVVDNVAGDNVLSGTKSLEYQCQSQWNKIVCVFSVCFCVYLCMCV